MPRFDGTGPLSAGPGTGWGLGPCGAGMAWRRGRRMGGRGWGGFWGRLQITEKEETEMLKEEAKVLEEELKATRDRLAELKAKN